VIQGLAALVAAVLLLLAALHLYWAAGGRWGAQAAVPERTGQPLFSPGPGACIAVAGLLSCAAFLVWARGWGFWPSFLPRWGAAVGAGGVGVVFVARAIGDFNWVGFFKKQRATRFARLDTRFYSPLCLALGVASLVVALT
jgi:hypothetical protein